MKSKKFLLTQRNEAEIITDLIREKIDFDVLATNYTTEIKLIDSGHSYFFSANSRLNFKLFGTLSKLKKETANIIIPDSAEGKISYYSLNKNNFKPRNGAGTYKKVFNIDITAAYATVLKNKKYISTELFNTIMKLPKMDRLAIVGMLATKKVIYEIRNGKEKSARIETDEQRRKIFFEASKVIDEILFLCRQAAENSFLFFWVDGIYLKDTAAHDKIKNILSENGLNYKEQVLTDFNYIIDSEVIYINYINQEGTKKQFNLPINQKEKIISTIKKATT